MHIYRKEKVQSFLRFRIYLSMTFRLCISFYSNDFLIKLGRVSFGSVPRNIPWELLLINWDELNHCVRRTGAIQATMNQLRENVF